MAAVPVRPPLAPLMTGRTVGRGKGLFPGAAPVLALWRASWAGERVRHRAGLSPPAALR